MTPEPEVKIYQKSANLTNIDIGWITTHGENDNSLYTTTCSDAVDMNATFSIINSEINSSLLNNFDIVVIEQGGTSWSSSELNDLVNWVNNGGSVYILGDDLDPPQLDVSNKFNIHYNASDPIAGDITNLDHQYPILNGVISLYSFFPGASINVASSTSLLMYLALTNDSAVIVTALQVNLGRILINVDADGMIMDSWISADDNELFANNSWLWLADLIGNGDSPPYNPPGEIFNPILLVPLLMSGSSNLSLIWIILILVMSVIVISIVSFILIRKRKPKTLNEKGKTTLLDDIMDDLKS